MTYELSPPEYMPFGYLLTQKVEDQITLKKYKINSNQLKHALATAYFLFFCLHTAQGW